MAESWKYSMEYPEGVSLYRSWHNRVQANEGEKVANARTLSFSRSLGAH